MNEFSKALAFVVTLFGFAGLVTWLFVSAMDQENAAPRIIASGTLLVVGLAFALTFIGSDRNPNNLCVHGHQEWMNTGKGRHKVWVCETWEAGGTFEK